VKSEILLDTVQRS